MKRVAILIILISLTVSASVGYAQWHPEVTARPRLIYLADEVEQIRSRIPAYHYLWHYEDDYGNWVGDYNVPQKLDSDLRRIWDGFEEQKPWNVGVKYVQFRKGVYDESTQAL